MKRLSSKLTYANVTSTLCLLLLLGGGTAYAASQLGKNSVGSKQLKKEAVTPAKLSKASKATLTGPPGPKGDAGPKGDKGEPGTAATVLWAVVGEEGNLARGKGVSGAAEISLGQYYVEFQQNISQCSFQATTGSTSDGEPEAGEAGVAVQEGDPESVEVWTAVNNSLRNLPFHLAVFC